MMNSHSFKNEKGQTSVEYILLVGVVVILLLSVFGIVKERFIGDLDNCTDASKSIGCRISGIFKPGSFEYFRIYR